MSSSDKFKSIKIINSFSNKETIQNIADELSKITQKEKNLSFRKIEDIKKLLLENMIYCLFIDKTLAGFLMSYKLSAKTIEINCLYIKKEFRKNNLSSLLINHATAKNSYAYFAATFLDNIKHMLICLDFKESSLRHLSNQEKFNFLKQRIKFYRLKEFLRHKKNAKLNLMKKECQPQL